MVISTAVFSSTSMAALSRATTSWGSWPRCCFAGVPVLSKSGHAFMKQRMREVDGLYGGEMSAHHYFRRFAYCDSGMIPWLIVAQRLSESGQRLSQLVGERMSKFPVSGELNYRVPDAVGASAAIES